MSSKVLNCLYVLAIVLVITPAATAQTSKRKSGPRAGKAQKRSQPADPRFTANAMLDDDMIEALVRRISHDLSISVGMDDQTSQQVQQSIEGRWVPFLKQNRTAIAPLISRFYSAAIDPAAPDIDEVKKWSKDALGMYDMFISEMDKTDQDIAKHLSRDQINKYKLETGKVRMGLGLFRGQLVKWEQGQFDYNEWNRQQTERDRQRRTDSSKIKQEIAESALESPELTLVTLGAWDQYVADFIKKYNLDEAQKSSANSVLADVKDRANSYIKKHTDDIDKLRTRLQSISAQERPAAAREKAELIKPLEELFAEMKKRLEKLPTDAQRTKAASAVKGAAAKAQKLGSKKTGISRD